MESQVSEDVNIPLIHIADARSAQLITDQINTIGLLGSKLTMQHSFYRNRLIDKFSIDVIVPTYIQQYIIHRVIYGELKSYIGA